MKEKSFTTSAERKRKNLKVADLLAKFEEVSGDELANDRMIFILILNKILDILYPRRCILCDGVLDTPDSGVCTQCRPKLNYVKEPSCKKCGKADGDERGEYCYDCREGRHSYAQGKSIWVYQGEMKQSIYRFKDGGRREYAEFYAKRKCETLWRLDQKKGYPGDHTDTDPLTQTL